MFYQFLPEDKGIHRDTVSIWKDELVRTGYAVATLNAILSACNLFLSIGCRAFKTDERFRSEKNKMLDPRPELTRTEYLRMLNKAREKKGQAAFPSYTGARLYGSSDI